MPGPVFVDGDRLALRVEERADLETLQDSRNDPAVRRPLTMAYPENRYQAEQHFEEHSDGDGVALLPCREPPEPTAEATSDSADDDADEDAAPPDDDPRTEIVGKTILFMVDEVAGNAELAYWIRPAFQGNGYATEAAALTVEYAFAERRLHKVNIRAMASNTGSRNVIEKLGASEDGRIRDAEFVDGEYVDTVKYSLLADDWAGVGEVV